MIQILPSPSLAPLTTIRLGGSALAEIRLNGAADYDRLPDALARLGGEPAALGGGSNLLIAAGELPLTLIRPLSDGEPCVSGEEKGSVLVRAHAGMRMPALLAWCAARGLSGLEGLVGVPGRLGGAVAMNAGGFGCSLGPLLRELSVFTPEQGLHTLSPEGWEASYRHFALTEAHTWFVVTEAVLALRAMDRNTVRETMACHLRVKKSSQPITAHTAGCVFKNPPQAPAGRLLDEAGLRGKRRGNLFFSAIHANFLVHNLVPGADPERDYADATALIRNARETVAQRFGIHLEMEIKVWPCPLY